MVTTHNLGFPRIGAQRELKFALEKCWKNESSRDELKAVGAQLRERHWQDQARLDFAPVGDFAFYDQVLDMSFTLGNLPAFPTTTIGSFPQTSEIRHARSQFKAGALDQAGYKAAMEREITRAVKEQEVLVHGEAERNDMELLDAFDDFRYPNEIGPGVYDIHSPNIPSEEHIVNLMKKAAGRILAERLWVNPDCGLKTRAWAEVIPALTNRVAAEKTLRQPV